MGKTKKILIISYYYPPMGGVEISRVTRFLKHLGEFSWEAVVLTTDNACHHTMGESCGEEIHSRTEVWRSKTTEYPLIREPRNIFQRFLAKLQLVLAFPDEKALWCFHAIRTGIKKLMRKKVDLIFTTSFPFSTHIIGVVLSILFRKPLLIDMRDAWTLHPQHKDLNTKPHLILEKFIFSRADRIIFTSKAMREAYQERYPGFRNKYVVIYNSFDSELYAPYIAKGTLETLSGQKDYFDIVYTGSMLISDIEDPNKRTPLFFLKAVKEIIDEKKTTESGKKIRVIFAGPQSNMPRKIVERLDLSENVVLYGNLSKKRVAEIQNQADMFVIIEGCEYKIHLLAKLFEYMVFGKPILNCGCPEGDMREIIDKYGLGITVTNGDVNDIKRAMLQLINSKDKPKDIQEIEAFSSREKTRELVEVLEDVKLNNSL